MKISNGVLDEAESLRGELLGAIERVMRSGWLILGTEVEQFEEEFAQFAEVPRAVGVASGTDALTLLLRSHDIGPGDEVVIPANSVPTLFGVARSGVRVRFADVSPDSFSITPESARAVSSPATKAIILVHLYGAPVDPRPFREEFGNDGIKLFEDCAQAHGAQIENRPVGGLADGAAWSFYPTKNLSAMGDGGAVTLGDHALADRVARLRRYGEQQRYVSGELGFNSRLDELQAAVLRVKLLHLEAAVARRREIAAAYAAGLPTGWVHLPEVLGSVNARHLFPVLVEDRDRVLTDLKELGIPADCHYPVGAHRQPFITQLGQVDECPITDRLAGSVMTLPIHPYLSAEDVEQVMQAVRQVAASQ
jgi:dTDP-4-amino-4,6-dideoxygalactose transaminase